MSLYCLRTKWVYIYFIVYCLRTIYGYRPNESICP